MTFKIQHHGTTREKIIDTLNFIKMKNSCSQKTLSEKKKKDTVKKIRRQGTAWLRIFAEEIFDKGVLWKTYKEHLNLAIWK